MKRISMLFFPVSVLASVVLTFVACRPSSHVPDSAPLYRQASDLVRQGKYPAALDAYNKAIRSDTLNGFSGRAIDALCRKSRIEFLTGAYTDALHTYGLLARHAGGVLSDSMQTGLALDRSRLYEEQGGYAEAASAIEALALKRPWMRLRQAGLYLKGGQLRFSADICREYAGSADPALRMVALSGLLECALSGAVPGLDSPRKYAAGIAAVSGRVMTMDAPAETRIHALRTAARSLQKLEERRRDASFLLFRALVIAEEAGLQRLVKILQFESNAVIVQKPDVYRDVIDYFDQKNMPYARMSALYRLGRCPELSDAERIDAFRRGLDIGQYDGIPATAGDLVALENVASGQLTDLLVKNNRYFELYEVSEQVKLQELRRDLQANISGFKLPAESEKLQEEIIRQTREINGLLQRQITMFEEGAGFEQAALTENSIRLKKGRLIELVADAGKIDKRAAALLQLTPVTMRTVQKSLGQGEAVVRFFVRDTLCTGLLVSGKEMHIASTPVDGRAVLSGLSAFRRALSCAGSGNWELFAGNAERLALNAALIQSMADRLARYDHLIFIVDTPVPFHLLGSGTMLGREQKISLVGSSKELVFYREYEKPAGQDTGVMFFDVSRMSEAKMYRLTHPGDRVFLCWKPLTAARIGALKIRMKHFFGNNPSGAGFLKILASDDSATAAGSSMFLSSYGID